MIVFFNIFGQILVNRKKPSLYVTLQQMMIILFFLVRLVDTDIVNYGKLQVHNESGWFSVCDTNFDDADAKVACRTLGFKDGRAQLGSALGTWITSQKSVIGITDVNCTGNETMFRYCQMGHGHCQSGHYVTLACTHNDIDIDNYSELPPPPLPPISIYNILVTKIEILIYLCSFYDTVFSEIDVDIPMTILFGDVDVSLYDVKGSICDDTWNDAAALVVCREKGFVSGNATRGSARRNYPTLVSGVNCTGNERALRDCKMKPFNETSNCLGRSSRAAVICSKKKGQIDLKEIKNMCMHMV